MAAPNMASPTSIVGKTNVQIVNATGNGSSVVANNTSSGHVFKLNTVIVSNVDGATAYTVNVAIYRFANSTYYRLAYQVSVPAGASLDLLSKSVYLEEGDALWIGGSTANKLEAVVSYEDIS